MYRISSLMDLCDGRPGFMIPVFSGSTNIPYVQQQDERYFVSVMIPFFEYDKYHNVYCQSDHDIEIGDPGIISFRDHNLKIVNCSVEQACAYYHRNEMELGKYPLFKLGFARIANETINLLYGKFEKVAAQNINIPADGKLWVRSEHKLFQQNRKIWDGIGRKIFKEGFKER
jgi:hypothetical protein